jgi:class 3 adenylate cyclase
MIVTWPAEAGSRGGPIRAALAAAARLAGDAGIYEARFGLCPRFRAALHCGPVVSGEMGDLKQEIVFLGDALNTAARIEEACSDRGEDLLLSAALLARVPPPPGFRAVRPAAG